MANEDTALREVDQELAEERQWALYRKYGPALIGGALAIVIGVGAWQFWNARQEATSKEQALEFKNAVEMLADNETEGQSALAAISEADASGYSVLAAFHRASSLVRSGDRLAATDAYQAIYEDGSTPRRLRDLARLRAAYYSLGNDRDLVLRHLGDLPESGGAFAHHATEISGIAALEAEDYETALTTFQRLSTEPDAPEPVRTRADDFAALALAAKSGVNITGQARVDDLLDFIGEGAEESATDTTFGVDDVSLGDQLNAELLDLGADHEGHDHGPDNDVDNLEGEEAVDNQSSSSSESENE